MESLAVFQAKTQAKIVSIESPPRTHDPAAANAGAVDCEATSMEENWLCCADGNTDASTCTDPAEVCLTGNEINSIVTRFIIISLQVPPKITSNLQGDTFGSALYFVDFQLKVPF